MPPQKNMVVFTNKNEISTQNMGKSANDPQKKGNWAPNLSLYVCGKSSHMGRPFLSQLGLLSKARISQYMGH